MRQQQAKSGRRDAQNGRGMPDTLFQPKRATGDSERPKRAGRRAGAHARTRSNEPAKVMEIPADDVHVAVQQLIGRYTLMTVLRAIWTQHPYLFTLKDQ
jgi:hypothetical protein